MKNHTTAHTADDLLIKYVYIILLFQRKNEYSYTVGEGLRALPQTTKTWEYNDSTWSDLLTNFNGESITYDEIGNPLTIGEKSLTWTGRQLQGITDDENTISYTYNGDGLRTSKTVNGETTNYYYNGSILAGQKTGDDTLVFMYDNNSDIFGFIYNDTEYYYIKNAQNDVIAIADADGSILVKYEYDAWGKVITVTDKDGNEITETTDEPTNASNDIDEEFVGEGLRALTQNNKDSVEVDALIDPSNADETTTVNETATVDESASLTTVDPQIATIADLNPILYRSYYYDKETEWYYLNTRYYSPDMCRFINADGYIQTGQGMLDKNMFAYCGNNPIKRTDLGGACWFDANGNWCHDKWETVGKDVREPKPDIPIENINGEVFYIFEETSMYSTSPKANVIISRRKKGPGRNNNFEVRNSYRIVNELEQRAICQVIIDYNKNHPDDSGWNRDIDTMIVEWDWHNWGYEHHLFTTHTDSVNFDMGLGTNSTSKPIQIGGYFIEYAGSKIENLINKTRDFFQRGL